MLRRGGGIFVFSQKSSFSSLTKKPIKTMTKSHALKISPTLEQFRILAGQGNTIPVYAILSADSWTPVQIYQSFRTPYSFLFESAERTGEIGRYSYIGRNPGVIFESKDKCITITEDGATRKLNTGSDPLGELQALMSEYHPVTIQGLPPFVGGAVGYLGYDTVCFLEPTKLKVHPVDELDLPDSIFAITRELACVDHLCRRMYLICSAKIGTTGADAAYLDACVRVQEMSNLLLHPPPSFGLLDISTDGIVTDMPDIISNTSEDKFRDMVEQAKRFILAGDIIQVVLSQRFETPYSGDPLTLYRSLWAVNPSPYMFCVTFGKKLALVGSSPEVHVKVCGKKVEMRPIAGTRKRGVFEAEDINLEEELKKDPKEVAEHVMLVDLARNDIGKIASYGSVDVPSKFQIERFSHVMHLVSSVVGNLRPNVNSYDVMRATFPAGTVSGAPKIRAMQIIRELELRRRGPYAGAVGWFSFNGNHDSCIALRSVVIKNEMAYVQAGAGIVSDSISQAELIETRNKARGILLAIARAKALQ